MREVTREEYEWASRVARTHYESCTKGAECSVCSAWAVNRLRAARRGRQRVVAAAMVGSFFAAIVTLILMATGAH